MNLVWETKKNKQGYSQIIGCDEVGRGSLAGPVVAAAVVLNLGKLAGQKWVKEVNDSKKLSPKKRQELSEQILQNCLAYGIAEISNNIIDKINIHQATLEAMKRAVVILKEKISGQEKIFLFVDGRFLVPELDVNQSAVVKGDGKIFSVAAASILAKVYRDRLMEKYHEKYPLYNFAQHKGYGTMQHRQMVINHGLSKIHRVSFCSNLV